MPSITTFLTQNKIQNRGKWAPVKADALDWNTFSDIQLLKYVFKKR